MEVEGPGDPLPVKLYTLCGIIYVECFEVTADCDFAGAVSMHTNDIQYPVLNAAAASVTLLYYHLLAEGGVTHSQTVYIDPAHFDPQDWLNVEIEDGLGIDQALLREGALMHLLCDLDDLIGESEDTYLSAPFAGRALKLLSTCDWLDDGVKELVTLIAKPISTSEEFRRYQSLLHDVYCSLVVHRYAKLIRGQE